MFGYWRERDQSYFVEEGTDGARILPSGTKIEVLHPLDWKKFEAEKSHPIREQEKTSEAVEEKLRKALGHIPLIDLFFEIQGNQVKIQFRGPEGIVRQDHSFGIWSPQEVYSLLNLSGMGHPDRQGIVEGTLQINSGDDSHRFRLSGIKTAMGESVTLRRIQLPIGSKQIGLPPSLTEALTPPEGLMLICGRTGSGKTTTLHHLLQDKHLRNRKVITIEDPVEYIHPQHSQTEVRPDSSWTFETSLPHLLRADPDVLAIGEIRSPETAHYACRAALTGHAVYATLHAASAKGAIQRLKALGISNTMLRECCQWILWQSLERTLCPHCAQEKESQTLCPECGGSGLGNRKLKYNLLNRKQIIESLYEWI